MSILWNRSPYLLVYSTQLSGEVPDNDSSQQCGQSGYVSGRVVNIAAKNIWFTGSESLHCFFIAYSLVLIFLAIRVVSTVAKVVTSLAIG